MGLKLAASEQNGCLVTKVNPGEAAERAGLLSHDLVTYVNNRPTRNLREFREVLTGPRRRRRRR